MTSPDGANHGDDLRGVPGPTGPPRSPLRRPDELTPEQHALYTESATGPRAAQTSVPLVDAEGRLLGPFALMLLAPGVGSAVQQVGATLRTGTELSSLGRELAILTVASHQRSAFEWEAHEHAARQAGADSAQLQAVLDGAVPDGLPEVETCVARTARTLVTLQTLPDDDYDRAVTTLGTAGVAELVWLVGYYAMLALALATLRPAST